MGRRRAPRHFRVRSVMIAGRLLGRDGRFNLRSRRGLRSRYRRIAGGRRVSRRKRGGLLRGVGARVGCCSLLLGSDGLLLGGNRLVLSDSGLVSGGRRLTLRVGDLIAGRRGGDALGFMR